MAISKRLATLSLTKSGKRLNVKNSSVDLPLSNESFKDLFPVCYNGESNFKETVTVRELEALFGTNWHTVHFKNSNTRKRIIGLVMLHYRKKTITQNAMNDSR